MSRLKIGITHGDINGISYEVILKTLADPKIISNIVPIIYGSPKVLAYYKKAFNNNSQVISINTSEEAKARHINVLNCNSEDIKVEIGKSTEMAGLAAYQALEKAVQDLKNKNIDLIVTAPINKKNIQAAGFNFPGHTEFFAKEFNSENHLMILMNDIIKIGVVTGHIPITQVASTLTIKLIKDKITILNKSLKNDFLIRKPRIAVLSLNPHCGDEGLIGNEEENIIIPAIQQAKEENILAFGTYPADGFFGAALYKKFDAVLAMYHDQGLAPFKVIAFEDGVNYTAGLPIVRTSPAHGTAYDIAGKDIASEQSFRSALYKAIDIFNNRKLQAELEKGKLNIEDLGDMSEFNKNEE